MHNDCFVDGCEELVLRWVVTHTVDELVKLGAQLLDDTRNTLPLCLENLVFIKVFNVLCFELLKDFTFVGISGVDLNELLDGVEVVMKGNTLRHNLLLALTDGL